MDIRTIKAIGFREDRHPEVMRVINEFAAAKNTKYPANAVEFFLREKLPLETKKLQKQNSDSQSAKAG